VNRLFLGTTGGIGLILLDTKFVLAGTILDVETAGEMSLDLGDPVGV
jgi:hypothetical protein